MNREMDFPDCLSNKNRMDKETDILMEELLVRYYDGTATEEEARRVEAWMDESAENRRNARQLYTLLFAADTLQVMKGLDTEASLRRTKKRIAMRRVRKMGWIWMQRAAAVLFLPLVVAVFVLYGRRTETLPAEKVSMIEMRTNPGMVASFRLPDSTLVCLNSGSVFRYPSAFKDSREVYLDGEAYFEVTKDTERRFVVSTPQDSKVEVFGTCFNLEAFGDADAVIATLTEGSIGFIYKRSGRMLRMLMSPGEKVVYKTADEQISRHRTDGLSELSWREGKVILSNTSFRETLHMLEKRYNVDFIVKNTDFDRYSFTGTFTNQHLERILEYFKISSHIRWRYLDDPDIEQEKIRIELY